MKKEDEGEEFAKFLLNMRTVDRIEYLRKRFDECVERDAEFLDAVDDILEEKLCVDMYRIIPEYEFTDKMEELFDEEYENIVNKLDDSEFKDKNDEVFAEEVDFLASAKYAIVMETKSGSELPVLGLRIRVEPNEKDSDDIYLGELEAKVYSYDLPDKFEKLKVREKVASALQSDEMKTLLTKTETVTNIVALSNYNIETESFDICSSPEDELLAELYKIDPPRDIVRSKSVIIGLNIMRALTAIKTNAALLEECVRNKVSKTFGVDIDNWEIYITKGDEEVIYINMNSDEPDSRISIISDYPQKRINKILNGSMEDIGAYIFHRDALENYLEKIFPIAKERGIIKDEHDINLDFKIPDEIGKSLMNMKEPDSSVLIERLEEYIKEHPEELEFIELDEMEK